LLIEGGGASVLVDPVFADPFEGDMVSCPTRVVHVDALPPIDAIFLSHGHHDHCDLPSLRRLPRTTPIYCPDDPLLLKRLGGEGFSRLEVMRPFERLAIKRLTILPAAAVDDDELGMVFAGDGVAVWDQVDTAAAPEACRRIFLAMGKMPDVTICPFNPLLEHTELWVEEVGFPTERYERLLEAAIASGARAIVPGSSGQRHGGADDDWKNHREFPVSRQRFLHDLAALAPEIQGVLLNPGEALVVSSARVHTEPTRVAETLADDEHLIEFAPTPAPPLVDDNPRSFPEDIMRAHLEVILGEHWPAALKERLTPRFDGPWRHLWSRRATVQVEAVFPSGAERAWHIAAWHPEVRVAAGPHPAPDYVWRYIASQIYAGVRGEPIANGRFHARRRTAEAGAGFRLAALDPFRLNDLDGYFVVDNDLPWHPLIVLAP
jgi:hypothetical protein